MSIDLPFAQHRRAFLGGATGGLGLMALTHLLQHELSNSAHAAPSGRQHREPHHTPSADAVICLFQHGGPSQMDLFDPKPELTKRNGQKYDGDLEIHFPGQRGNVLASPFKFQPHGESGIELSEMLPHTAKIVDEMTLIRSVTTESVDHESALRLIHSGKFQASYPTWAPGSVTDWGPSIRICRPTSC